MMPEAEEDVMAGRTVTRAYLRDGMPSRAVRLADWFRGPVAGGTLEGVSDQHRVRLAARLGPGAAAGTITFTSGQVYGFTAPLAAPSRRAGLSEGSGRLRRPFYHTARIVLRGGGQRGAAEYPSGPIRGYAAGYFPLGRI
jgi:hypothetical protein